MTNEVFRDFNGREMTADERFGRERLGRELIKLVLLDEPKDSLKQLDDTPKSG